MPHDATTNERPFDAVVIGAGIAGLSAARALANAGNRVTLVEARSRVGGRIYSVKPVETSACELPIELGAEFVHGKPRELMDLISEAGKTCYELQGEYLCSSQAGQAELEPCARDDTFSLLDELPTDPDMTFQDWITEKRLPPDVVRSAISYIEGFNAADARIIGTASLARQQHAEDAIEGGRLFRIEEGYASIAEYLLQKFKRAGGEVLLSTIVRAIEWKRGTIHIDTANANDGRPGRLQATKAVITLPLGVLQSGSVRFDPVPERSMRAANQLAMGCARRITFIFRERFWAARYPNASFLFPGEGIPAVWWTPSPKAAAMLTGWIGGPRACRSSIENSEQLAHAGIATLARIFALPEQEVHRQILGWHAHDWQSDPFSLGAYSYAPRGAIEASPTLAEPVEDTLFFAGEHTDTTGHWGTVHGALRSGLRAAEQIGNAS